MKWLRLLRLYKRSKSSLLIIHRLNMFKPLRFASRSSISSYHRLILDGAKCQRCPPASRKVFATIQQIGCRGDTVLPQPSCFTLHHQYGPGFQQQRPDLVGADAFEIHHHRFQQGDSQHQLTKEFTIAMWFDALSSHIIVDDALLKLHCRHVALLLQARQRRQGGLRHPVPWRRKPQ
mmetsp:Transcript_32183/g.66202  ORF Transcript_32183/g.66202 Transcript_32183/m.66202 type:complete len:177 (-) Transcript_32183:317-847(-)